MCGIAGVLGAQGGLVERMIARLRHRGPDAARLVELPEWRTSLGHARLAVLDPGRRSDQPFASACGRYVLSFNGEIYNYLELRERLVARGWSLRTESDTEVLLGWLVAEGSAGLVDLDGAFALAFVDRRDGRMLLARDALGEKPLYHATWTGGERGGEAIAFCSEIGPLAELEGVDRALDEAALADWLRFLYTPAPRTLLRGIAELPPGHLVELDLARPRLCPRRWYDLEARSAEPWGSRAEALRAFRDAFETGLARRLRSDVPLGIYLSAGMDSNAILGACAARGRAGLAAAYTARYEGAYDESLAAARAARARGVAHHAVDCRTERFHETLARTVELFAGPFGNATAVAAEQLAREAARGVRVALVGDGGDELCAGYPRHAALALHARLGAAPAPVRTALRAGARVLPERGTLATGVRRLKAFSSSLGQELAAAYLDWSTYVDEQGVERATGRREAGSFTHDLLDLFRRNGDDPLRAAALVDFASFVPFNLMQAADRTGMAHGLELRAPFLAPRLVEAALRVSGEHKLERGRQKPLLADALAKHLPARHARRAKRAFNPPVASWLRTHARALREHLSAPAARLRSVLDPRFVALQLRDFEQRRRDNSTLLWGLATLETWLGRDPRPTSPAPSRPD